MEQVLKSIRPVYITYIKNPENAANRNQLRLHFERLERYTDYYVIKENILFPVIEKNCLNISVSKSCGHSMMISERI